MLLDAGCAVRGDEAHARHGRAGYEPASEADWRTEYLDSIISVRVVEGLDEAIAHIERCGSHHTDCIVTENQAAAERFLKEVDSAIVMHNASTQFADGGEFGFGAEIGIATGRMHARGPGRTGAAHLVQIPRAWHWADSPLNCAPYVKIPPFAPGLRMGLFGGSFNPPHDGHRAASLLALRRLRLDRIWWLVSPANPLKDKRELAPLAVRAEAARQNQPAPAHRGERR